MQLKKAQSALEFITTYAYVFLIIAIALAALLLYFSFPKTVLPFECNFYSGFTCTDAALVITPSGSSLYILAVDNQPGTINVSSFNAVVNNQANNKKGSCLPRQVSAGQYIYCVANFTGTYPFYPSLTQVYYGNFLLQANYCVGPSQNLTVIKCPSSNAFEYTGSVRLQPSQQTALSNTINSLLTNTTIQISYAPITITNNQLIATPAPFQELLAFPTSTYNTYISSTWNNVEFSTLPAGRGTLLEAWIEDNASNTLSNTIVWVNLPSGIGANSSTTIYVNFLPVNIISAYGPTGESPLLSKSYAKYDNGAYVFDFYDNFAGNTLSTLWGGTTGTVTVNNGLKLSALGSSLVSSQSYSPLNQFLDVEWSAITVTAGNQNFGFNSKGLPTNNALYWEISSTQNIITANTNGQSSFTTGIPKTGTYVFSLGQNSIAAVAQTATIGNELFPDGISSTASNVYNGAPTQITLGVAGSTSAALSISWIRIRGMPPNNHMPTVTYNSIVLRTT